MIMIRLAHDETSYSSIKVMLRSIEFEILIFIKRETTTYHGNQMVMSVTNIIRKWINWLVMRPPISWPYNQEPLLVS